MELDTILNIMTKYNLTADELLLVYITFIAQSENGDPLTNRMYFKRWYDGGGQERLRELFNSLKTKGVILKNYNPEVYNPEEIEFNSNFLKSYFKLSGTLGKELELAYPSTMYIQGKMVSLKNIAKKFMDKAQFYFWYAKTINHDAKKHAEIIDILQWAVSQNLVQISIIEFIASEKWVEFKELRENGVQGTTTTFNIYQSV